jgi:stage II sporulation protein GA (sporulation sigma-E factor processing peptidase)
MDQSQEAGAVYVCRRILIGLNPKPLAQDGSYRAILHPSMIQAEEADPAAAS